MPAHAVAVAGAVPGYPTAACAAPGYPAASVRRHFARPLRPLRPLHPPPLHTLCAPFAHPLHHLLLDPSGVEDLNEQWIQGSTMLLAVVVMNMVP